MDSTDPGAYHAAEPDPVAAGAAYAIEHLNEDHADALLDWRARSAATRTRPRPPACGSTATAWTCDVQTPRGIAETRIAFAEPANKPGDLRGATVELARRARGDGSALERQVLLQDRLRLLGALDRLSDGQGRLEGLELLAELLALAR